MSWYELAREAAAFAKLDVHKVRCAAVVESVDTSLTSERGLLLRPLEQALAAYVKAVENA